LKEMSSLIVRKGSGTVRSPRVLREKPEAPKEFGLTRRRAASVATPKS
jgi:hypothetical protein